ncbi:STM4015 family protein [Nocardiopsis protaetiae]|uniref:STM4015 family protein n=1 Tax=Nocardiopsis protaetiae TaxID=3382270 RepID=UPI00387B3B1A
MRDPLRPNEELLTGFGGLPVVEFPSWDGLRQDMDGAMARPERGPGFLEEQRRLLDALAAPQSAAWRVRMRRPEVELMRTPLGSRYVEPDPIEDVEDYLDRFFARVPPAEIHALIVGNLPTADRTAMAADRALAAIAARAVSLGGLRSLFFGEILREELELSWIGLGDLGSVVAALPGLRDLTLRGASLGCGLRVPRHENLEELTVQSAALPVRLVDDLCASDLPALRRLELWTGVEEYRGVVAANDLDGLLSGDAFPALRHLGLRNAEKPDIWIASLARSPLVARLEVLDLSLGALTDSGGLALVRHADAFAHLKRLDLHHHFLGEKVCERLRAALPGVDIDLSEPRDPKVLDWSDRVHYYTVIAE